MYHKKLSDESKQIDMHKVVTCHFKNVIVVLFGKIKFLYRKIFHKSTVVSLQVSKPHVRSGGTARIRLYHLGVIGSLLKLLEAELGDPRRSLMLSIDFSQGNLLDANVWLGGGNLKIFYFHPLLGEMIQFDEHIFQMGWFNHQQETWCKCMVVLRGETPFSCAFFGSVV